MSTLHDDEIRTIAESGRLDPQADTDGDDTDTTDGDSTVLRRARTANPFCALGRAYLLDEDVQSLWRRDAR